MTGVTATYRLQLSPDFTLRDVRRLTPYLAELGISHLYLSPILRARRGSTHGYDVVDPTELNPQLGVESELSALSRDLDDAGLGIILDIVPNHMATGSENPFWQDVLAHGRASPYAAWFDIDWGPPGGRWPHRILLPVLGDRLGRVIDRGELRVHFVDRRFRIGYHEASFPIDPATVPLIIGEPAPAEAGESTAVPPPRRTPEDARAAGEIRGILDELRTLPSRNRVEGETAAARHGRGERACDRLAEIYERSAPARDRLESMLSRLGDDLRGRHLLRRLLAAQAYRLAYWRRGAREINYRRFFTISHLVAVRVEDPGVFEATHRRILEWIAAGVIDGLRIDHVDGLLEPTGYLQRLRHEAEARGGRRPFPIYVEKILAPDESLPRGWPVAGTTGYDFLGQVEDLLLDPAGLQDIRHTYRWFLRKRDDYEEIAYRAKRAVLEGPLTAEVRRLARRLQELSGWLASREERGLPAGPRIPPGEQAEPAVGGRPEPGESIDRPGSRASDLQEALREVMAAMPVYRTYLDAENLTYREQDRSALNLAFDRATARGRADRRALGLLRWALLLDHEGDPDAAPAAPASASAGDRPPSEPGGAAVAFVQRFQQTCVPVAAKGAEDSAFYRYVPLASRNEVGSEPGVEPSDVVTAFHRSCRRRFEAWPRGMLCATTHDTKRSADVRSRLDVLTEVPGEWRAAVRRWHRWNRRHRSRVGRRFAPDRNTEYLLYQTLVGVWPTSEVGHSGDPASGPDPVGMGAGGVSDELRARVAGYMEKAIREAKQFTSWVDPNAEFEAAVGQFVQRVLDPASAARFLADLRRFVEELVRPGFWNGLARTLLLITSPGTPDLYQGDELWNFSLVDPDNRRPVDFERRERLLAGLVGELGGGEGRRSALIRELLAKPEDGRIKLLVVRRGLAARRGHPELFAEGEYLPLETKGEGADHVVAFVRRRGDDAAIVIVPRLTLRLAGDPTVPPTGGRVWSDTALHLPERLAGAGWRCALTGRRLAFWQSDGALPVAEALAEFPLTLLMLER